MKTLLSCLCLSVCLVFADRIAAQNTISEADRNQLVQYYQSGSDSLHAAIAGLSDAQLNWKPADSVWSIAECVAHIALSETEIFDGAQKSLKSAIAKDQQSAKTDQEVMAMVESRSHKVKTHASLEPVNKFENAAAALADFDKNRKAHIDFLKSTQEDLRHHFTDTPLGKLDSYQLFLFINSHTLRHIAQITALKSMAGFPAQ